jgi:hypothetical protein
MSELDKMVSLGWTPIEAAYAVLGKANLSPEEQFACETLLKESRRVHEEGKKCHSCKNFTNLCDGSGRGECREWKVTVTLFVETEDNSPMDGTGASVRRSVTIPAPRRSEDGCERWEKSE